MATTAEVIWSFSIPSGFDRIRHREAKAADNNPGQQPEKIEGQPEDHGLNPVPKGHGEAHADKGNQPQG
jgi:hypothetical protein